MEALLIDLGGAFFVCKKVVNKFLTYIGSGLCKKCKKQ